jgi:hypothetical protein
MISVAFSCGAHPPSYEVGDGKYFSEDKIDGTVKSSSMMRLTTLEV